MSEKQALPPQDIRAILGPDTLDTLREHYDLAFLLAAARHTLGTPFPPAAPWAAYITESLYSEEFLPAKMREAVIISILMAERSVGPLMVHFYWGLMSGLTPHEIGAIITVGGTYGGVDRYTTMIRLFADTLRFLEGQVVTNQPLDSRTLCLTMLNGSKN